MQVSDRGEGFVQAITSQGGEICTEEVTSPLDTPVSVSYAFLPDMQTEVLEMSAASGLELVPFEKRNPMITTTYGTGELILKALRIILIRC